MNSKKLLGLALLTLCGALNIAAQDAVTAVEQITSESSLVSGTEYLVYYVGNGSSGYMKDTGSAYTGKNDDAATEAAVYVFTSNGNGTWTVQNKYTNKFWGTPTENANTYIGSDTGGSWALNFQSGGNVAPSCNEHSWNRSGNNIHPWSKGTANVNQFKIYTFKEVTILEATASEVYTINNTNTNRGALIYNPEASTKYVWSSGKSGTFDATAANSQWVMYPTGTEGVYYMYNVGADKFAIPTGIAQSASNAWIFSDNAVPVIFTKQSDGTYKIQMYATPVSGTNAAYVAVSNSYAAPIINYNDAGSYFTVTKVDGNQSAAVTAAVNKLAGKQTALTAAPTESGWYAVQIKSKSNASSYAGRYLYNLTSLYNSLYPFGFTGGVDVHPAITDPTYYTYIDVTNNYWQAPDGKYLVLNANNKFPTPATEPANVTFGYNGGSYFKCGDYYADPYNSGTNYFVGETNQYRTTYNVYPIDLTTAGLVAWKVVITNASESTQLTCNRTDVSGLTTVYNNGTFFLPTDVTPESSDFSMDGMQSCTIDSENKTITAAFDPSVSILASDVQVIQGNQTTGLGNTQQALLRVKLAPFSNCTLTNVAVTLTNADQLTNVGAYLTTNDEMKYTGTEITTFSATNEAAESVAMTGSQALTAGTTYYLWITGDVSATATEWNTIDAAIEGISYTNDYTIAQSLPATALDLTEIGDPDGEMRIFSQQAFLWTPSNNNTKYYRIPTILQTADGDIIAFTDDRYNSTKDLGSHKIDVVMKKSTDNGATWGDELTIAAGDGSSAAAYGYGDAAVVRTLNGKLICIMAAGQSSFPSGMQHVGVSYSSDNGATWTDPTDIYEDIDFGDITPTSVFTTAGKGVTFSNGRVAFAMNVKVSGSSTIYEYVLYSDNADEDTPTWQITTSSVYTGADESKLEIMNDNSLLVSVRRGTFNGIADRGYNRTTGDASGDGINTWGDTGNTWSDLKANGCNADILYYNRSTEDATRPDVILHTLTKQYSTYRKDLRLYMSFDQGATWKEAFQLQPGYAAYSSMQKLANGDLAIIFEDGSVGNVDKQDCYAINYVVISKETLEAKIYEYQMPEYITENGIVEKLALAGNLGYPKTSTTSYSNLSDLVENIEDNYSHEGWTHLQAYYAAYTAETDIVTPESGKLYKIYHTVTGTGNKKYLTASLTTTVSPTSPNDIFCFINNQLVAYADGYAINQVSRALAANSGTFTFSKSNTNNFGKMNVYPSSGSPWYVTDDDDDYTLNRWSGGAQTGSDFEVSEVTSLSVTISATKYASFYAPVAVSIPEGVTAYMATDEGDYLLLTSIKDGIIPASTGVILYANITEATTYDFDITTGGSATSELTGSVATITKPDDAYYLSNGDSGIGFYKGGTATTLAGFKAYLIASGGEVKTFRFSESTAIETIEAVQQGGTIYDLSGRRVQRPVKGIFIQDGKKVVVK